MTGTVDSCCVCSVPSVTSCFRCFRLCCSGISVCIYILFVSDQFASRLSRLSELALSHMIPPEKITDTQIGVATWLLLWWIASSFAGSLVTMGLHQHADWWNLVPYTGPRASLPHTAMFPVRKRKNPQKPPLSNEEQRPNDTYAAEWKMSRVGVYC